jgi:hypothetical protein
MTAPNTGNPLLGKTPPEDVLDEQAVQVRWLTCSPEKYFPPNNTEEKK